MCANYTYARTLIHSTGWYMQSSTYVCKLWSNIVILHTYVVCVCATHGMCSILAAETAIAACITVT